MIILICSAVLSLGLSFLKEESSEWVEGAAILFAVFIVVLVTATNEWTKDKQFQGLMKKVQTDSRVSVIRNGQSIDLIANELLSAILSE